jgi:hypothetical protein
LREALANLPGERAGDDVSVAVDQQRHRRSDAPAVLRELGAQRPAVGTCCGVPERRVRRQQPRPFDEPLRVELEQPLERFCARGDLVGCRLASGQRAVDVDERKARHPGRDHHHDKRGDDAGLDVMQRKVGEAHRLRSGETGAGRHHDCRERALARPRLRHAAHSVRLAAWTARATTMLGVAHFDR